MIWIASGFFEKSHRNDEVVAILFRFVDCFVSPTDFLAMTENADSHLISLAMTICCYSKSTIIIPANFSFANFSRLDSLDSPKFSLDSLL